MARLGGLLADLNRPPDTGERVPLPKECPNAELLRLEKEKGSGPPEGRGAQAWPCGIAEEVLGSCAGAARPVEMVSLRRWSSDCCSCVAAAATSSDSAGNGDIDLCCSRTSGCCCCCCSSERCCTCTG